MPMHDLDRIIIQAAATDLDERAIEGMVLDALSMVHAGETMAFGKPASAFGWTFYPIYLERSSLRKLLSLPGSDIVRSKGDTIEQKFVNWLNQQVKKKGMAERIHFTLASDLHSSRYGLF